MVKFMSGKLGKDTLACHTEHSEVSQIQNRDFSLSAKAQNDKKNKAPNDGTSPFDKKEINLPVQKSFIPDKPLKFSKEAKAVFDAGREIWKYYHTSEFKDPKKPYNANASLYDIKEYFQGRKKDEKGNETGRMNARSADENYNGLMANLRFALKTLATKITPKIYEYGFLRA